MDKTFVRTLLVALVSVLVGITIVQQQMREPILTRLMSQQTAVLQAHINQLSGTIDSKVAAAKAAVPAVAVGAQDLRVTALEQRIDALETQIKTLQQQVQQVAARPAAPPPPPSEDFTTVHEIPVAHTPVIGPKNAQVTITEFMDFQCPFCARFHPAIDEAMAAYPGKVNILVKNFPLGFHPNAKPAAKAALAAAEQGKYKEMVDALLQNGRELSDEKYEQIAKDIGLNVKKFLKDYKDQDAKWEDYIQKDLELGGKVGVRGTPTFYINGRKTNARDINAWKKEIDAILEKK